MALAGMTQEETNAYNRDHCKRIAEELEEYANGNIYKCPECGEHCTVEEEENENGETVYKCSCGCVSEYEPEQLGIYDYMDDILDITFTVDRNKQYKSCSICVAWGGPSIYIDTDDSYIKLFWWTDNAKYPLSYSTRDAIDEWAEEYFNCI